MIDEPTFCAQSLNFLYAQFKAPSKTDSWCVGLITSNDHEPLIAHPGSYDADRCIHRNDHGQPRGRIAPAGKQGAVLAWGSFLTLTLNFIIIAFVLFMVIRAMNQLKRKDEAAPAAPPKPTREEELLTEIRDLLKKN